MALFFLSAEKTQRNSIDTDYLTLPLACRLLVKSASILEIAPTSVALSSLVVHEGSIQFVNKKLYDQDQ